MNRAPSATDVQTLTDQSAELLGKRLVIEGLHLPETTDAESLMLTTRGKSALVVSHVELYTHLIADTPYKKRFDKEFREAGRTFTFPVQGGIPAVSVVLHDEMDAIAVIKHMMSANGEELSWPAALEKLGASRSQFKGFIDAADSIDTRADLGLIRLEDSSIQIEEYDHIPNPKPNVKNLAASMKLVRESRVDLKSVLSRLS